MNHERPAANVEQEKRLEAILAKVRHSVLAHLGTAKRRELRLVIVTEGHRVTSGTHIDHREHPLEEGS